jgi:hypothetical protein
MPFNLKFLRDFRTKKLSQIVEEEEGISRFEDPKKSSYTNKEYEMRTGINNNSKFVSKMNSSLDKSKKKGSKPILKEGFKTAYDTSYEKFLSNVNESDLKHMNTMNINGKNFHLLENIRRESHELETSRQKEEKNKKGKEMTAEQKILELINEESSQHNTLRNTLNSQNSRNNFSFRNNNNLFRFEGGNSKNKQFFTSKEEFNRLNFMKLSDRQIYNLENKMKTNPEFLKNIKLYDRETFDKKNFLNENDKNFSGNRSVSVTNNEITNNNHNVNINNKMNTYIIIVNDKNEKKMVTQPEIEDIKEEDEKSVKVSNKNDPEPLGKLKLKLLILRK